MEITLAHLFADILNLSADKGNILSLKHRTEKRNIGFCVKEYKIDENIDFKNTNILLIGGGCEKDKITVTKRLLEMKEELTEYIKSGGVILAVASSYPIVGKSFEAENEIHEGLGLIDMTTVYDKKRKTGNVILESELLQTTVTGFENHNDKTTFNQEIQHLGKVVYGTDKGKYEGIITDNIIATHLHGPILPKNPELADYIIQKALKKNGSDTKLEEIDSSYEKKAHNYILDNYQ